MITDIEPDNNIESSAELAQNINSPDVLTDNNIT